MNFNQYFDLRRIQKILFENFLTCQFFDRNIFISHQKLMKFASKVDRRDSKRQQKQISLHEK